MQHRAVATATIGAVLVLGWGFSTPASATFASCTGTTISGLSYDISDNVAPTSGCTILEPLDNNDNDSVNPPASSYTVNVEQFFDFSDWVFNGKYDSIGTSSGTDTSAIFDFSGGNLSGNFSKVGSWTADNVMFVFKDGGDTNLVGYLIDMTALASTSFNNVGTYTSPFEEPPFDFPGASPRTISHISVYTRGDGGPPPQQIPEPGPLALLGLGLAGMWAIRRRPGS